MDRLMPPPRSEGLRRFTESRASGFTLAPGIEWQSGFPYSVLGLWREYRATPNGASFPSFLSLDVLISKTLTVAGQKVHVGAQIFNVMNHGNLRDVFAVAGGPGFGSFANSVGPTFRGVRAVSWQVGAGAAGD
jgi:hypothetical protein